MRLVFSYAAFSDPKQAKGRSKARQAETAASWAKRNGFTLAPERQYVDEGLSRYTGEAMKKGKLGQFLKLCGTPAVPEGSILVIEDFDRLSRENLDDAWEMFHDIIVAGVEIVVLSLGKWFTRKCLNSFEDRLIVQACQHRAHQESARKADRLRDVWAARRRRARKGKPVPIHVPGWMRKVKRRRVELIPERVATMREIIRLANLGYGGSRIAQALTADPERWPCWFRSQRWDGPSIVRMLKSPNIWGAHQPMKFDAQRRKTPAGELIEGVYPALLTKEEAEALRRKLSSRRLGGGRRPRDERNLLRNLGWDAETGQRLRLRYSGTENQHDYLGTELDGVRRNLIPYRILERIVVNAVQDWSPNALLPPAPSGGTGETQTLLAQLADIEAARTEAKAEMRKLGRARRTLADLVQLLDDLDAKEEEVKAALEAVKDVSAGRMSRCLTDTQALMRQLDNTPSEARADVLVQLNAQLRDLLDGVWVFRRNLGVRRAEVWVQVWPRVGPCKEVMVNLYDPPEGWKPLDLSGVDLRRGYPHPLPSKEKRAGQASKVHSRKR